jgi:opacity protein-like surface antigen
MFIAVNNNYPFHYWYLYLSGGLTIMRFQRIIKECVYLSGLATLLCLATTTSQASADTGDYEGPYTRLLGGLNFTTDSDFTGSNADFPSGEASLASGAMIGLGGGYRFNRNFAAELEYAYRSNDIDKVKGAGGATISDGGDLASVAIMANGLYYFDFADNWSPYVGLGFGFLQEIDSDVQLVGRNSQKDLEDQVFAWQAMAGAEVPIDDKWRVYGESRFMSAPSPDLGNSNGSYSVDYNNISLIFGIGYQF